MTRSDAHMYENTISLLSFYKKKEIDMKTRFLGELGEITLRKWAAEVGLIANKAGVDLSGWDFILEFPNIIDPSQPHKLPLDKQSSTIPFLVQVKSTDSSLSFVDIKLDNMIRLVKSPMPTFILALDFQNQTDPVVAYLVHIGEELLRRTLKRLRKASSDEISKLNKKSIKVNYNDTDMLASNDGNCFYDTVVKHIGENQESYVKNKIKLLEEVGYNGNPKERFFNFTIKQDANSTPEEMMIDFSLGLLDSLPLHKLEIEDRRFGVNVKEKELSENIELRLSDIPPHSTTNVKFNAPFLAVPMFIKFDVYLPQWAAPVVSDKLFKIKLCRDSFYILIVKKEGKYVFSMKFESLDLNKKMDLHRIIQQAKLIKFFQDCQSRGCPFDISISTEAKQASSFSWNIPENIDLSAHNLPEIIDNTWHITKRYDIHTFIKTTLDELISQRAILIQVRYLLDLDMKGVSLLVNLGENEQNPEDLISVPATYVLFIGDYKFLVAGIFIGRLIPGDELLQQLNVISKVLVKEEVTERGNKFGITDEELESEFYQIAEEYSSTLIIQNKSQ